jgi:hypothetical protein
MNGYVGATVSGAGPLSGDVQTLQHIPGSLKRIAVYPSKAWFVVTA